jgi:hypothetical protein
VIVEVAACALFMLEPVTDARISTSTTAESVTENFEVFVLFIVPRLELSMGSNVY